MRPTNRSFFSALALATLTVLTGCGAGSSTSPHSTSPIPASQRGAANSLFLSDGVGWLVRDDTVDRSVDGGRHWKEVYELPAALRDGVMSANYFLGPQNAWLVVAASPSGPYQLVRTTDGATRWSVTGISGVPRSEGSPFFSLDFANPSLGWMTAVPTPMEVGAPLGILRTTTNGGSSWSASRNLPLAPRPLVTASSCSPPNCATTPYVPCPSGEGAAVPLTDGNGVALFGCGGLGQVVWDTRTGGVSWNEASFTGGPSPTQIEGWSIPQFASTTNGTIMGFTAQKTDLFVTSNGGQNWTMRSTLPLSAGVFPTVAMISATTWVASISNATMVTTDSGDTWTTYPSTTSFAPLTNISFASTTSLLGYNVASDLILVSSNSGSTWSAAALPAVTRPVTSNNFQGFPSLGPDDVDFVSLTTGWLADASTVWRTVDGGRHWTLQLSHDGAVLSVDMVSPSTGWVLTSAGIWRTTDGGKHWLGVDAPVQGNLLYLSAPSATVAFGLAAPAPETGPAVLVTTHDAGKQWSQVSLPAGDTVSQGGEMWPHTWGCFTSATTASVLAALPIGSTPIVPTAVLTTTNGGKTWLASPKFPDGITPTSLTCSGSNILAATDASGVGVSEVSTDNGKSWASHDTPTAAISLSGVTPNGTLWIICAQCGSTGAVATWTSTNAGDSWVASTDPASIAAGNATNVPLAAQLVTASLGYLVVPSSANGPGIALWTTTNAGHTWSKLSEWPSPTKL